VEPLATHAGADALLVEEPDGEVSAQRLRPLVQQRAARILQQICKRARVDLSREQRTRVRLYRVPVRETRRSVVWLA
jgi:hypothetical protein